MVTRAAYPNNYLPKTWQLAFYFAHNDPSTNCGTLLKSNSSTASRQEVPTLPSFKHALIGTEPI